MVCYLQFYRPVFEKKTVLYAQFLARAVEFRDVNEANLAQGQLGTRPRPERVRPRPDTL